MFRKLFLDHPSGVGESYARHCVTALRFSAALLRGGMACFVHAFVPGLFARTGSRIVERLHGRMAPRRSDRR